MDATAAAVTGVRNGPRSRGGTQFPSGDSDTRRARRTAPAGPSEAGGEP